MKIQFRRKVKDVLGRDLSDGDLGWACCFALANAKGGPIPLGKDQKFTRGLIAQQIMAAEDQLELTVEQVAEIKAAVGEFYSAALVAPIWQALEKP